VSENLDLVRSIFADWERGDWGQSDNWMDPQMELVFADGPEPQTFTGRDQIRSGSREFLRAWSGYTVVADEYRELSAGRILVLTHATGLGRASGVVLSNSDQGATVVDVAGGKVTKIDMYFDRDHAFADLGLEE